MSEPLIFDTSVWIDFLKNKRNQETDLLTSYIEQDEQVLLTFYFRISANNHSAWRSTRLYPKCFAVFFGNSERENRMAVTGK
jgi:hypothetical protein